MLAEKENFLKNEYIGLLRKLDPKTPASWGKMDVQQMIEHMRDVFKVANGKIVFPVMVTDPEKLAKMREFIMSDAPFRENTKVPVMPEEPRPHKYSSIVEAISKTEEELLDVFTAYIDPSKVYINPMFGELDYEQQVHLLYKHSRHHLRQFGVKLVD